LEQEDVEHVEDVSEEVVDAEVGGVSCAGKRLGSDPYEAIELLLMFDKLEVYGALDSLPIECTNDENDEFLEIPWILAVAITAAAAMDVLDAEFGKVECEILKGLEEVVAALPSRKYVVDELVLR
jgi:hypothetical protein